MADEAKKIQIVQRISDGTATIGDFLEAAKLHNPKVEGVDALRNYFPKDGMPLDKPWTDVANEPTVSKMLDVNNKLTKSATFMNIANVEKEVALFYKSNKDLIDDPTPYKFSQEAGKRITGGEIRTGNAGIARSFGEKADNPKAYQVRGTRKFKSVPKASLTVPKLMEAVRGIPDANTRAAVAFNMFVPFRPGEVAGLKVADIDFSTGLVSAYHRGNKTRTELFLPEVALEILRDATEEAKVAGRDTVFDTSTKKMSDALTAKGNLKDLLKPYLATFGRELKGSADLRKIVPSLLAKELGGDAALVSSILGHAEGADGLLGKLHSMTSTYYVSAVEDASTDPKKHALNVIQHMMATNIGAKTLNELPGSMGVSAKALTSEGANAIEAIVGKSDISEVPAQENRPLTPDQQKAVDAQAKASTANLNKTALQSELEALGLREQIAAKEPEVIEIEEKTKLLRQQAKADAKRELLGDPVPEEKPVIERTTDAEYKAQGFTDQEISSMRQAEGLENFAERADMEVQARQRIRSEKSSGSVNKLKEFMKKNPKTVKGAAIAGAAYLGKKAIMPAPVAAADFMVDVADFATMPSPAGETPLEDVSSDELMTRIQDDSISDVTQGPFIDAVKPEPRRQIAKEEATSRYVDDMDSFVRRRDTAEREAKQQGLPKDKFKPSKSSFLQKYEDYYNQGTTDEYVN